MKCPHCGGELEKANGSNGAAMGELFAHPRPDRIQRRSSGAKAATRIRADWLPDQKQRHYAELQGKEPDAFAKTFVEYYLRKGSRWLDWGLVWQKACREWKSSIVPVVQTTRPSVQEKNIEQWRLRLSSKVWSPFWGPRIGEPGCQVPEELLP